MNICGAFAVFANKNNTYAVIEKGYNSGNISSDGDYSAAGIVGANYGTVTNCYNTGNIIASGFVGGITRVSYGNISGWDYKGIISNCYNIGTIITKTNSYSEDAMKMQTAGGIIGNCRTTNITNCYTLDTNYNYNDDSTYGKICSIGKMTTKSTYKGFDFDNIWEFNENGAYKFPTLKTLENYAVAPTENTMDFEGGYGTKSSPYIIKTKTQLNNIRKNLTACYRLDADINFSASDFAQGGAFYNDGKGWEPIGNSSDMFAGTLDGNSHTISGLVINRPNEANIGLFGYSCGNVIDLNMSSCKIEGETKVGCIAGYNYTGKIIGCNVAGEVVAYVESDEHYNNYTYAGGVAGYSGDGNIDSCKNSATVKVGCYEGWAYAGGIAGFIGSQWGSEYAKIINCSNDGKIMDMKSGDSAWSICLGGIVGENHGNVDYCYNTGYVQGTETEDTSAAGIAGSDFHGSITCSYNLGSILSKYRAAGILAECRASCRVSKCYNAGEITVSAEKMYENQNVNAYAGGIVGNAGSLDEMDCCYNAGSIIANYGTVGGLIGKSDVDDLKVNGCYNVGYIDCTTGDIGGIAGECESTITDCFYLSSDKVKKGIGTGTDQGTSCTSAELQNVETYGEAFDFDYDEIWAISDTADYKYPILTEVVNPELQYTLSAETRDGVADTPTAKTYGNGKITVNATAGQMYVCLTQDKSMSVIPSFSSSEWKKATGTTLTFDSLEAGTTYEIYTYIPASGSQKASYISQALIVTLLQVGDPTGDGNIDFIDALYMKRALAGWDGYTINFSACDVDGNGEINDADVMYLERHIAGWKDCANLPKTTDNQTASA